MTQRSINLNQILDCHINGKVVSDWIFPKALSDLVERKINPLSVDLLKIGMGLYFLEVLGRYPDLLKLKVYEPKEIEKIKPLLITVFQELTGHKLDLLIEQEKRPPTQKMFVPRENYPKITLFSGGLDSVAGTMINSEKQILLNCVTSRNMYGKMKRVYKEVVQSKDNEAEIPLYDVYALISRKKCKRTGNIFPNTRSILFLFSALAISLMTTIEKIQIFENGPLLLNPSFSSIANPTLGNRPEILFYITKIVDNLSDGRITLEIPFINKTKQEIVNLLTNDLANKSYSCSYYRKRKNHCGICYSCFVRRLSIIGAGYSEDESNYQRDVFSYKHYPSSPSTNDKFNVLLDFIDFCLRIVENNLEEDPEINEVFRRGDIAFNMKSQELYKRFASQSLDAIKNYYFKNPEYKNSIIAQKIL